DPTVLFSEVSFSQPGAAKRRWHRSGHSERHSLESTGSILPSTRAHSIRSNHDGYANSHRSASISSQEQDPRQTSRRASMDSEHLDPMAARRASVVSWIHRKMSVISGGDGANTQRYLQESEEACHSEKTNPAPTQQSEMVAVRDFASQAPVGSGRDRKTSHFGTQFQPEVQFDDVGFEDFTNEPMPDSDSDSDGDSDEDSTEISSDTGISSIDEKSTTDDEPEDRAKSVNASVSSHRSGNTTDPATAKPKHSTAAVQDDVPAAAPEATTTNTPDDRDVSQLDPKAVSATPGSSITTEPIRKRQLSFAIPEIQHSGNLNSGQTRRRYDKRLSLRQIRGAEEETPFSL
ncbi:hypothetical protein EDD37DRAFT_351841, partial [Exophiala viscosa]|uniref:uncharacterized protein n=1 Tax=Exophiala viscosa TaxID=2486360 RepID=UPI002197CD7D